MGARTGMAGQGGEALELALGLLRAPALRTSLRTRALPEGIGEVLAVASGSSDAAREASARTGHPEAELVEASRFYVQQVLLAEGADAYRNLGAAPDATHAVLREHHHLLMRWLHPDRSEGAQWDSALSTRVNQAWNHLRTPQARATYDATPPSPPVPPVGAATAATLPPIPYTHLPPPTPIPTGPIAVAFLTIACLALAWLALTREDRLDALRDASHVPAQGIDVSARMAAPLPRVLAEVDVRAPAPREALQAAVAAVAAVAAEEPQLVQLPEAEEQTLMQLREAEEQTLMQLPEAEHGRLQPAPVAIEWSDRSGAATVDPNPTPVGAAIAATRPKTTAQAEEDGVGEQVAAIAAPTGAGTADPVRLFRDAETALDSVTTWFASAGGAEPFWLDLPVSIEAAALRQNLQARHPPAARSRMTVVQPNWTLGSGTASVSGAYRLHGRRGTVETGMLSVQLARRGEHWRIARLHLEPAR